MQGKNDAKWRSTICSHVLGRLRATKLFLGDFRPRREQNVPTYWTGSGLILLKSCARRGGNNMCPLTGTTWPQRGAKCCLGTFSISKFYRTPPCNKLHERSLAVRWNWFAARTLQCGLWLECPPGPPLVPSWTCQFPYWFFKEKAAVAPKESHRLKLHTAVRFGDSFHRPSALLYYIYKSF